MPDLVRECQAGPAAEGAAYQQATGSPVQLVPKMISPGSWTSIPSVRIAGGVIESGVA